MALWTSPITWIGAVVTVPQLNEQIRDNLTALHWAVLSQSSGYTIPVLAGENVFLQANATSGPFTIVLATAVGRAGAVVCIKKMDTSANVVTVDGNGLELIDGATTFALSGSPESITLISDGANWSLLEWSRQPTVVSTAATYTATVHDDLIITTAGVFTVTLHPASNDRHNRPLTVKNTGTGIITVDGNASELIDDNLTVPIYQWESLTILPTGTGWIIV